MHGVGKGYCEEKGIVLLASSDYTLAMDSSEPLLQCAHVGRLNL